MGGQSKNNYTSSSKERLVRRKIRTNSSRLKNKNRTSLGSFRARTVHAETKACLANVIALQAEAKIASVIAIQKSWQTNTITKKNKKTKSRLLLTPSAQALLPNSLSSSKSGRPDGNDLGLFLHQLVIQQPNTIQCMIDYARKTRKLIMKLTPCTMSLQKFIKRSNNDPQARIIYKIVREAAEQCKDYEEYYITNFSKCNNSKTKKFSAFSFPPFATYDDENDKELNELSMKYWDAEYDIERIHKLASSKSIDPGYACECIAILCHAFEVQDQPSPIGINLFQVTKNNTT